MKNLLLLSLAFLFVLSSCSSDDSPSADNRLIGLWKEENQQVQNRILSEVVVESYEFYNLFLDSNSVVSLEKYGEICDMSYSDYSFDGTKIVYDPEDYVNIAFSNNNNTFTASYMDDYFGVFNKIPEAEYPSLLQSGFDSSLVGEWELVSVSNGETLLTNTCNIQSTLTINNDGTYNMVEVEGNAESCSSSNDAGKWASYSTCGYILINSNTEGYGVVEYEVEGNTLVIEFYDEDSESTITQTFSKMGLDL